MAADDTNSIAGEAEDTRERISATIDELQDRLNPRRIVGDAVGSVQQSGQEFLDRGLGLAKGNPAILLAAGAAVALAVFGGRKLKSARVNFGDESESYSDYDDSYVESGDSERFALLRGPAAAASDNPLVAVAVGLAAGALLGALFPETERERELFGATGARIGNAARAAARTARDELSTARDNVGGVTSHAKSAVQSVVDAAKTELNGGPTG